MMIVSITKSWCKGCAGSRWMASYTSRNSRSFSCCPSVAVAAAQQDEQQDHNKDHYDRTHGSLLETRTRPRHPAPAAPRVVLSMRGLSLGGTFCRGLGRASTSLLPKAILAFRLLPPERCTPCFTGSEPYKDKSCWVLVSLPCLPLKTSVEVV